MSSKYEKLLEDIFNQYASDEKAKVLKIMLEDLKTSSETWTDEDRNMIISSLLISVVLLTNTINRHNLFFDAIFQAMAEPNKKEKLGDDKDEGFIPMG